jgi:hypothetical protein
MGHQDKNPKSLSHAKDKDLLKNPSYKNMINPYESKYPQKKKAEDPATQAFRKTGRKAEK